MLIEFASNKDLVDALNFGFYLPPSGGRAGKFLDEQRTFKDYPMDGTNPVLEVRKLTDICFFYKNSFYKNIRVKIKL